MKHQANKRKGIQVLLIVLSWLILALSVGASAQTEAQEMKELKQAYRQFLAQQHRAVGPTGEEAEMRDMRLAYRQFLTQQRKAPATVLTVEQEMKQLRQEYRKFLAAQRRATHAAIAELWGVVPTLMPNNA